MPFELRLPVKKPTAVGGMSRDELNAELAQGIKSLNKGKVLTADEFDAELARDFSI